MLELVEGNLLEAPADALVNTVNTEGVMGKGIALQFAKKFPEMLAAYRGACKAGEVQPGQMHVFERTEMFAPRYIINFPTKRHWRANSRLEDIDAGLVALVEEIRRLRIQSVAVPPLGCGNGGLNWADVLPLIRARLGGLKDVKVLVYPPKGAPTAGEIVHKTEVPKMTPSRAIILKIWQQYFALGYQLTLLEVHKTAYFLQEAGEKLDLRFAKETYGPYADNLRHVLHRFEGHLTLGFADGRNKPETEITLLPGAVEAADEFLRSESDTSRLSLDRLAKVGRLIDGFESPYGMELLSTVHWVAKHEGASTVKDAIAGVHAWNARKRKLMTADHVTLAWKRLGAHGWIG